MRRTRFTGAEEQQLVDELGLLLPRVDKLCDLTILSGLNLVRLAVVAAAAYSCSKQRQTAENNSAQSCHSLHMATKRSRRSVAIGNTNVPVCFAFHENMSRRDMNERSPLNITDTMSREDQWHGTHHNLHKVALSPRR